MKNLPTNSLCLWLRIICPSMLQTVPAVGPAVCPTHFSGSLSYIVRNADEGYHHATLTTGFVLLERAAKTPEALYANSLFCWRARSCSRSRLLEGPCCWQLTFSRLFCKSCRTEGQARPRLARMPTATAVSGTGLSSVELVRAELSSDELD